MRKNIIILFAMLLASGCVKEIEPPQGLIGPEKMAIVLTEIHELDASVSDRPDLKKTEAKVLFEDEKYALLQSHSLDSAQFNISFDYYLSRPDKLKNIYGVVVDSLRARKDFYSRY